MPRQRQPRCAVNIPSLVVRFHDMPASAAMHVLMERHASTLRERVPGLENLRLQATVKRMRWPSRGPTVQVLLRACMDERVVTASAGDFGASNAFIAMETAFAELRSQVGSPVQRHRGACVAARTHARVGA